jgi:ferric-dicitrate binding protein FerR (iron transport regulator)
MEKKMSLPIAEQTPRMPNWVASRTDTWQASQSLEKAARREVIGQIQEVNTRRAQRTVAVFLMTVAMIAAGLWFSAPHPRLPQNAASGTIAVQPSTLENVMR